LEKKKNLAPFWWAPDFPKTGGGGWDRQKAGEARGGAVMRGWTRGTAGGGGASTGGAKIRGKKAPLS